MSDDRAPVNISRDDLRGLLRVAKLQTYPEGAVLCQENSEGDCAFLIRRGTVEIFKTSRGRRRTLAVRGRNEVVGEMALFEQRRRTATACALEPVRALALQAGDARDLVNRHPRLSLPLLEMMSHRLRAVQQDLLDDLTAKVEELEEANEHLEVRVATRTRELQASNEALARTAVSDYLTGCYNRRWLMEELHRWSGATRPLGVVLMDLDHFKHYNDANGHLRGDELLRGFVRLVESHLRPGDAVARYGGEEFVLLLHGATPQVAYNVADRVRDQVARQDFPAASTQPLGCVSLSAGVATIPEDGNQPEELLRAADARLYLGKEQGRNRVIGAT